MPDQKQPKPVAVTGNQRVETLLAQSPEDIDNLGQRVLVKRWHEQTRALAEMESRLTNMEKQSEMLQKQITTGRDGMRTMVGQLAGIEESIALLDDLPADGPQQ